MEQFMEFFIQVMYFQLYSFWDLVADLTLIQLSSTILWTNEFVDFSSSLHQLVENKGNTVKNREGVSFIVRYLNASTQNIQFQFGNAV